MKKVLAMLLASSMILAFAACGNNSDETTTGADNETTTGAVVDTTTGTSEETTTENKEVEKPDVEKTSLEFFNEIWDAYLADTTIDEMSKLLSVSCSDPVVSEERLALYNAKLDELLAKPEEEVTEEDWIAVNNLMSGAGVLTLTEENNDYLKGIGFPVNNMGMVDTAATACNGMMANFFTVTVSHIKNTSDIQAFVDAYKASLSETKFVCGQPDAYSIVVSGDYVISIFGLEDIINSFAGVITGGFDGTVAATGTFY